MFYEIDVFSHLIVETWMFLFKILLSLLI